MTGEKNNIEVLKQTVLKQCQAAKQAAQELVVLNTEVKNKVLIDLASQVRLQQNNILAANTVDINQAQQVGINSSLLDRLILTESRLEDLAAGLEVVSSLADPIGQIIRGEKLPNGLQINQIRVPLGVVAVIYEARPNVTLDVFALTFKTGNAVLLRGSKSTINTNCILVELIQNTLIKADINPAAVQLVASDSHASVNELIQAKGLVDVVIPRGGADLIANVVANAKVPTIETGVGNCHIYVHHSADLLKAIEIVLNAKTRRPSVCNAVETLLIDEQIAVEFLPLIMKKFEQNGIKVHGELPGMIPATEVDWEAEYLGLEIAVKIVTDIDAALAHIAKYATGHTEAIIAESITASAYFTERVDSAVVMINASTAFTDGGEFGFGAEVGISTQKLHARGPMGLPELTTTKWLVVGSGQTRI